MTVLPPPAALPAQPALPRAARAPSPLETAAAELEASFLSEMLEHAGLGSTPSAFGGGIGEEQFASFLRQEQARQMVKAGGIGLAESIVRALGARENG